VDTIPSDLDTAFVEYAVVLKTDVKRRGTLSDVAVLRPIPPPPPPAAVKAEAREGSISIDWEVPEVPEEQAAAPAAPESAAAPAATPPDVVAGATGPAPKAATAPG